MLRIFVSLLITALIVVLTEFAASAAAASPTIPAYKVKVTAKSYAKHGVTGQHVKTIRISGAGVKVARPVISCGKKYCGTNRLFKGKTRRSPLYRDEVTFSTVNWIVAKGHGFVVKMVPRGRKLLGSYVEMAPPDSANKGFTIAATGCITRKLKKTPCPAGATLPAINHIAKRCKTPAFTRAEIIDPAPETLAQKGWDGKFIDHAASAYRVAGGAPLYVSHWPNVGGNQPVTAIDLATWQTLRQYPAEGTFIHNYGNGAIYVIAGGAPQYVSNWNAYGGQQPYVSVDGFTIAQAGLVTEPFGRLRRYPLDGTFISSSGNQLYRVAGGAPIAFTSWIPFGNIRPTVFVQQENISGTESELFKGHLLHRPADGTLVSAAGSPDVYEVKGGSLYKVCSAFDAAKVVTVSPEAIANAGGTGIWNHLGPIVG